MDLDLAKNIAIWANCEERIDQVKDWQTAALEKIVQGQGKTIMAVSANGVSTTFASSSMTILSWFNTLTKALEIIQNPTKVRNKSIAIFR